MLEKEHIQSLSRHFKRGTDSGHRLHGAHCHCILRRENARASRTDAGRIEAAVSGNILKNVKSVVVPNTDGLKGIPAAVALGIVAGRAEKELQVIAEVSEAQKQETADYLKNVPIHIRCSETPCILDIALTGYAQGHSACVRIANNHTNIVYMSRDGEVLLERAVAASEDSMQDKRVLNVADIVEFADTVDIEALAAADPAADCLKQRYRGEGTEGGMGGSAGQDHADGGRRRY